LTETDDKKFLFFEKPFNLIFKDNDEFFTEGE
jgi:hypothetical protein